MLVMILLLYAVANSLALFNVVRVIDKGIEVELMSNGYFKIGLVTIPANTLCKFPLFVTQKLICHICAVDCNKVHNRFGGNCGEFPTKDGRVCVCNDQPPPGGDVPTAVKQCGPLTFVDVPVFGNYLNIILGGTFNTIFIARQELLQCSLNSTGCDVDCDENHQYNSGACGVNTPVPLTPNDINETERQFCECNY